VYVIGGAKEFTGAPTMTSLAALKSGAGAVVLGIPRLIHPIMARKLTEVILQALPESAEGTIGSAALDEIMSRVEWADVVAIGPGLSRSRETDRLVIDLLSLIKKPVVLDADALTALAGGSLKKRKWPTVLTPHAGELSRLTGWSSARIESDRVAAARESAGIFRSVVVLKGSGSVISGPGGASFINSTGNPGMATIGSGDVLTGLIAGLIAQGLDAERAAWAGAFLHGLAGDMGAEKYGMRSLLAMDILSTLPNALNAVEGGRVNF
jgi:NAD(P)H-hydrate epimerase